MTASSADASGEMWLDQIPLEDGTDYAQIRQRFIGAIRARGAIDEHESCVIDVSDTEADFIEFCATTWPGRRTHPACVQSLRRRKANWVKKLTPLAEKFPKLKKQIEAFVLDRAKEALASSRVMNSNWHKMLETISDQFDLLI